jgi:hypothetical protein
MNFLEFGCACLTAPQLKETMDLFGYPGRGEFAALIGTAVWLYGYARANRTAKQLGYAILIALALVAVVTFALKLSLQLPRPTPRSGYGFPSGDSATAFAIAAAAGGAYPAGAPLFYLLATLTAIARLYFRAHFVWDVIGGALIGTLCGYGAARKLITARGARPRSPAWLGAWLPSAALAAASLGFFWLLEQEIARHKIGELLNAPALATVEFGNPSTPPNLRAGWTTDRVWPSEGIPFNWVDGLEASVTLEIPAAQDARLLLHAYPYRPRGFLCQRAEVAINGSFAGRIFFEQDWQRYALAIPSRLLQAGANRIDFTFVYADRSNWHGMNREGKALSVAFHKLQLSAH